MKWEKICRSTGLIEYICECGVGHPDYDSADELAKRFGHAKWVWHVHGCCGKMCCNSDDFPGKPKV